MDCECGAKLRSNNTRGMCKPCWKKSPAGKAQAAAYHVRTKEDRKTYSRSYYLANAADKWGVKNPGVGTGNVHGDYAGKMPEPEKARRRAMRSAQNRCAQSGVEFALTIEALPKLTESCPACGKLYDFKRSMNTTLNRPSLDRIRPPQGYIPGNVVFVCGQCNLRMQDSTSEDLFRLAEFRKSCGG